MDRNRERQLVGSLSDSYKFRKDGLIKKTMSIVVNGVSQHLISYYDPKDVLQGKLRTPSSVPELASLEISPELLIKQNFRIPPMVESTFDHHHHHNNDATTAGPLTPPDSASGSYGNVYCLSIGHKENTQVVDTMTPGCRSPHASAVAQHVRGFHTTT